MREYRFVTTWCLDAPIERVFDAIDDAARWPQWWKGVTRAELLEPGAHDGVGRVVMRQGAEGLARLLDAPLLVRS